jgi:hypothetical protein
VVHGSERREFTEQSGTPQLAQLPRRLFRKIVVEPTEGGWRARIVGFDARFRNDAVSSTFASRALAIQAAKTASRVCGLPVITAETLAAPDGPRAA